jgi:signal transduction histidine kinase
MDAKETSLYTAILIVSIIVATIIIFFIISIIRQQRKNVALYRQNVLAEITAMEKERARIAADLHDELGPMLSAIKLKIGSFELTDEDDKREAEKTDGHIDVLMKRLREISYDLIPNTLIRKGLVMALKQFTDFINEGDGLKINFEAADNIDPDQQKAIHIYRIAQEVINNTIRHSGAKLLNIKLKQENSTLFLFTADDGIGFDHQAAAKGEGGIGLRNILNRTEIIGGQMFIESKKDKGTKYSFEIPV